MDSKTSPRRRFLYMLSRATESSAEPGLSFATRIEVASFARTDSLVYGISCLDARE